MLVGLKGTNGLTASGILLKGNVWNKDFNLPTWFYLLCGWKQFVILWGYVSNTGTYLSIYGTHFISCYCILVKSPVCSPLPSIIMSNRHRHKITYKIFSIYSPIIENVRKREPLSVHNYKPQFDSTNKQRNMDPRWCILQLLQLYIWRLCKQSNKYGECMYELLLLEYYVTSCTCQITCELYSYEVNGITFCSQRFPKLRVHFVCLEVMAVMVLIIRSGDFFMPHISPALIFCM